MNDSPHQQMLIAARRLLRPVVRMLLRHGVMYRHFADLCKALYVDVATTDYGLRGRPTNVSRTALLTGLDRKEIRRLRESSAGQVETRGGAGQDRISRVLSAWHQDPDYAPDGVPMDLPVTSDDGPSFADLVRRYGGDVPSGAISKELRRVGAVEEFEQGRLRALKRYYMPVHADAAAMERAGSVLEDIGNTVVHNLFQSPPTVSRFEGRATNPAVDPAAIDAFREFLEIEGQQFLERVDEWLTKHEASGSSDDRAIRLGAGLYGIEDAGKLT